ncbi:hypothetical protein F5X96DRAFT_280217 [Biscogniauxia mediterranea]|nr:hypothetical protein F5X96DRAFT_280217 [Biscogniauxia mediterranea]
MPDEEVTSNDVSTAAPSDTGDDCGMEGDEVMPIIVSDILQPNQNHGNQVPFSLPARPQAQTPTPRSPGKEGHLTSAQPSLPSSATRIAVHIRSLSATSHISPSKMGQAKSTPSGQGRTMISQSGPDEPKPDVRSAPPLASTHIHEEGSGLQPKKRGRPKGWRPGMPYAEPKAKERKRPAETADGQEPKRRGRPPRAPSRTVREHYLQSNPDYTPFKCEWVGQNKTSPCPAELQNLETLRMHVHYVHLVPEALGPTICRWSKCAKKDAPPEFTDPEEFAEHMEEHFTPHLWHMGEGYQNKGISKIKQDPSKLPSYLLDEDGNQVTPSIVDQKLESEQQRKERKRKLQRLLYLQNENAPDEEEYIKQTLGIIA